MFIYWLSMGVVLALCWGVLEYWRYLNRKKSALMVRRIEREMYFIANESPAVFASALICKLKVEQSLVSEDTSGERLTLEQGLTEFAAGSYAERCFARATYLFECHGGCESALINSSVQMAFVEGFLGLQGVPVKIRTDYYVDVIDLYLQFLEDFKEKASQKTK